MSRGTMGKLVFAGEDAEKKKEMMTVGGVLFIVVILFAIALLWRGHAQEKRESSPPRHTPESVSVTVPASGKKGGHPSTFLLKPGPTELLTTISTVSQAELPVDLARYQQAAVLWPVYFFRIREGTGKTALAVFDSNADGFGVSVQAEIDAAVFPEIKQMQPGQQVWLAGEIVAVDAAGTGSVRLKADYCNTDGSLPVGEIVRDMAARTQH